MDNEIGIILGRKGLGKTTLSRSIQMEVRRALVLDTLGRDYGGGRVIHTTEDLVRYWDRVKGLDDFYAVTRPTCGLQWKKLTAIAVRTASTPTSDG